MLASPRVSMCVSFFIRNLELDQRLNLRASTPCFHSLTTARICSAAFSLGFTCLRLNQGNMPSKSGVTRICPSQSGPAPIPMVGIGICCVSSFATRGVTSSSTTAKAPASASACASASNAWCSGSLLPLTW